MSWLESAEGQGCTGIMSVDPHTLVGAAESYLENSAGPAEDVRLAEEYVMSGQNDVGCAPHLSE